jgi:hypothetical protein
MEMDEDMQAESVLTPELIAELKKAHGQSLLAVTAPNGAEIVLKKPSRAVWVEFVDTVNRENNKDSRYLINERLVYTCLAYPGKADAASLFAEYPAWVQALSGEVSKLAGASEALQTKKL